MASGSVRASASRHAWPSRPSMPSSASALLSVSRCSGPNAAPTCCCRRARGRLTARSGRCSSAGIQVSPTTTETALLKPPRREHPRHPDALFLEALRQGLTDFGYVEGENLTILARYARDDPRQVVPLARELASSGISLLVVTGAATPDTMRTVRNVPVIYAFSGDPVAAGWVTSLAKPNEGTTGITWLSIELNGRRIELLKEALPSLRRLAILANPLHPG